MAAPIGNKNARKKNPKTAQISSFRAFPDHVRAAKKAARSMGLSVGDYLMACAYAHNHNVTPGIAIAHFKYDLLGHKPPDAAKVAKVMKRLAKDQPE